MTSTAGSDPTNADGAAADGLSLDGPVAYLTGEYLRASHTFIWREAAALRRLGAAVHPCSIRTTPAAEHLGPEPQAEHARTFYVLRAAANPLRLLADHARMAFRAPGGWFGALALAFRASPPDPVVLFRRLAYFAEAGVLAAYLQRRGVVHLHDHFGASSGTVAMLASRMSGVPFSFTLHGPTIFFEPKQQRIDEKIARAAFVACISHFCRGQGMIFADPAHWERMRIVHCGIDPSLYDREPARDPDAPRLLFVGRLAAVKGVAVLLEALVGLRRKHPGVVLELIGDGPERPALEATVRELGLGDAVVFSGFRTQDEIAEALARTDIFVLPSFAEGVPVVLMEAMAARVAVIGPRVAGVQELVEDGVSGHTVPPGDVETLTTRIDELLRDPELRAAMGEAGRAMVEREFDRDKEARWLLGLIAGVRAGRLPEGLRPRNG